MEEGLGSSIAEVAWAIDWKTSGVGEIGMVKFLKRELEGDRGPLYEKYINFLSLDYLKLHCSRVAWIPVFQGCRIEERKLAVWLDAGLVTSLGIEHLALSQKLSLAFIQEYAEKLPFDRLKVNPSLGSGADVYVSSVIELQKKFS